MNTPYGPDYYITKESYKNDATEKTPPSCQLHLSVIFSSSLFKWIFFFCLFIAFVAALSWTSHIQLRRATTWAYLCWNQMLSPRISGSQWKVCSTNIVRFLVQEHRDLTMTCWDFFCKPIHVYHYSLENSNLREAFRQGHCGLPTHASHRFPWQQISLLQCCRYRAEQSRTNTIAWQGNGEDFRRTDAHHTPQMWFPTSEKLLVHWKSNPQDKSMILGRI